MAILEIELPDGRTAELEIPDGMSMEQAAQEVDQLWQSNPEAFGAQPAPVQSEQQPADVPRGTEQEAPGVLSQIEQFASEYFPPYAVGKGMVTEGPTAGGLGSYGRGVASGLGSALRGPRQAFNKLTGDEAELAQLNEQEAQARAQLEQDTGGSLMGSAGRMVGQAAPAALAGGALAPLGVGAGAGTLARMGAGAATGAAGGASTALTGAEEAGGDRARNAITGGLIGGALPAVTGGISAVLRGKSKLSPTDALSDFAERQLGSSKTKGASQAFDDVTGAIDDQYGKLRSEFSSAYDAVEKSAKSPVELVASSRLGDDVLSLPEEVSVSLSPTAKRVLSGVTRASTKTSPILDATGQPIQEARKVGFGDVREAIRELKAAGRALPFTDSGQQQRLRLDAIITRLDDDLTAWGSTSAEAGNVLKAAKELDANYAQQVAPFNNRETALGAFRKGPQDEKSLARTFLRPDSGQAVDDLTSRVPEAKAPLRELYGRELMTERGTVPALRAIEGGTTAEKLLSKPEREYLLEVAQSLRKTKGLGGSSLSPTLENILRQAGGERLETMMRGVQPFGKKAKKSSILADMLRAYGAGQATGE